MTKADSTPLNRVPAPQGARRARSWRWWSGLAAGLAATGLAFGPVSASEVFVSQADGSVEVSYSPGQYSSVETGSFDELNSGNLGSGVSTTSDPNSNANVARSITVGRNHTVVQAQYGRGNQSNVGIFGGESSGAYVLQAGDGLQSTVGMVNTNRVGVIVVQGPNNVPVNVLAIGLPGGGLMIAR